MHSHDRTLIARLGFDDPDKRNPRHDLACQYLALPETLTRLATIAWEKSKPTYSEKDLPVIINEPFNAKYEASQVYDQIAFWKNTDLTKTKFEIQETPRFAAEMILKSGTNWVAGFVDLTFQSIWKRVFTWKRYAADSHKMVPNPEWNKRSPEERERLYKHIKHEIREPINKDELNWQFLENASKANHAIQTGFIEVKIGITSASEMIRQINFYRQFAGNGDQHFIPPRVEHRRDSAWFLVVDFDLTDGELNLIHNENIHTIRLGPQFDEWVKAQQGEPPDMSWDLTV